MFRKMTLALAFVSGAFAHAQTYPLTPVSTCGNGYACWQLIDLWNKAMFDALVDDTFDTAGPRLGAVRWYGTESPCTGVLCADQLKTEGHVVDPLNHRFVGVTDELSNVLLALAIGSDREAFERVRNFAELLRMPSADGGSHPNRNGLQCWMYFIDGSRDYESFDDVCIVHDSASDASLRILGAYGIACAKKQAGIWHSSVDYCQDYLRQGNAIWGRGTTTHGEVKELSNGEFFLANGFNNQASAPTADQSFRPDYYELQFLYDFGEFSADGEITAGVLDMLKHFSFSFGDNKVPRGVNGKFTANPAVSNFVVTETHDSCGGKECVDQFNTFRAIPSVSGLLASRPSVVPAALRSSIFDEWWNRYGDANYPPGSALPFEIYSNSMDGGVLRSENSYKTLPMWIPLGVAYSPTHATGLLSQLVGKFDFKNTRFFGSAYYGGYYSPWAQRAIGIATGMLDRRTAGTAGNAPCCLAALKRDDGVELTWRPAEGVTGYEVSRSQNGAWAVVATTAEPRWIDDTVLPCSVYAYEVRGVLGPAARTAASNRDVASTLVFEDDPIVGRHTRIRAVHITQLRDAINQTRAAAGLTGVGFPPLGSFLRGQDMTGLRDALSPALAALGAPPLNSHFFAAGQPIERWHVQELRDRLK